MIELSSNLYYLLGALIFANLGTLGSIIIYGGRAIWWFSKLESRVAVVERDIEKIMVKAKI